MTVLLHRVLHQIIVAFYSRYVMGFAYWWRPCNCPKLLISTKLDSIDIGNHTTSCMSHLYSLSININTNELFLDLRFCCNNCLFFDISDIYIQNETYKSLSYENSNLLVEFDKYFCCSPCLQRKSGRIQQALLQLRYEMYFVIITQWWDSFLQIICR